MDDKTKSTFIDFDGQLAHERERRLQAEFDRQRPRPSQPYRRFPAGRDRTPLDHRLSAEEAAELTILWQDHHRHAGTLTRMTRAYAREHKLHWMRQVVPFLRRLRRLTDYDRELIKSRGSHYQQMLAFDPLEPKC